MRDSIKLLYRRGPARGEQGSTGALHSDGFESPADGKKKSHTKWCGFLFGRG